MNRIQYKRWKDFAIRMSEKGWPIKEIMKKEHQRSVILAVLDFFDLIESNYRSDVIRIESWDNTRENTNIPPDRYGRYPIAPYICDIVSEMMSSYNPFYWDDEDNDKAYHAWDDLWGSRINCCIRAGLDLAANPSAGVLGFTKADLERMYPEGVPKWISGDWKKKNGDWAPIAWDDMAGNASLWM